MLSVSPVLRSVRCHSRLLRCLRHYWEGRPCLSFSPVTRGLSPGSVRGCRDETLGVCSGPPFHLSPGPCPFESTRDLFPICYTGLGSYSLFLRPSPSDPVWDLLGRPFRLPGRKMRSVTTRCPTVLVPSLPSDSQPRVPSLRPRTQSLQVSVTVQGQD